MSMFDLTGKVALVTGASKGMGLAMATALADHGATVVIAARKPEALEAAAARVNARGKGKAFGIACNIGYKEQLEALVDKTRQLAGPIDALFGNAGVNPFYGATMDIPDSAYEKIMTANVQANLWLARLVASDMKDRGAGSIAFTSSVGAFIPSLMIGTYNVSKLALIGLVRNLAAELGPDGTRVNAICPGLIRTDFARELWKDPETERQQAEATPLRRLGEPDDFGGIAVFLASDGSKYITGQAMTVCGGINMWS